jgi:hypothetical protein
MTPEEQAKLDRTIRWMEREAGRALTPEEIARYTEKFDAACRQQRTLEWMHPFLTRQTTRTPNFAALYGVKAELDRQFLGDPDG